MTRVITLAALALLVGSIFWMFHVKHETRVIDAEITRTMKQAAAARERAGLLQAEYTQLNDPSRLAELAGRYLPNLQPTVPGQFTIWADFESRLPPIGAPKVAPKPLEPAAPGAILPQPQPQPAPAVTAAGSSPPPTQQASSEMAAAALPPPPPLPPPVLPHAVSASRPIHPPPYHPLARAPLPSRPATAPVSLTAPLAASSRQVEAISAPAPAVGHREIPYQPAPAAPPLQREPVRAPAPETVSAPVPRVASALGMARQMTAPPPVGAAMPWRPGVASSEGGQ
jgi:cell division protein FtsL